MVAVDEPDPLAARVPAPRVLLAEDDVLIRMDMADAFRDKGWEVVEAGTADDGLRVLERDTGFQLVLTDVHMPGKSSGLDLARAAKSFSHIKVAVMSGEHLPGPAENGLFDLFLAKPVGDIMKKLTPLLGIPNDGKSRS